MHNVWHAIKLEARLCFKLVHVPGTHWHSQVVLSEGSRARIAEACSAGNFLRAVIGAGSCDRRGRRVRRQPAVRLVFVAAAVRGCAEPAHAPLAGPQLPGVARAAGVVMSDQHLQS